jgi:hypothetical protein
MRRLSVRISDQDSSRLQEEAARRGLTEAEVVRIAVEELLSAPTPAAARAAKAAKAAEAAEEARPRHQSTFGGRVEEMGTVRRKPL